MANKDDNSANSSVVAQEAFDSNIWEDIVEIFWVKSYKLLVQKKEFFDLKPFKIWLIPPKKSINHVLINSF